MADEIPLANVVRLEKHGDRWTARVGPPGLGLAGCGLTAPEALEDLAMLCRALGWPFDDTRTHRD